MDDLLHPNPSRLVHVSDRAANSDVDFEPERTPTCAGCGYDLTGLRVEDRCPECGEAVWVDVEPRAIQLARIYTRAESSFYASCLAVLLSIGCGPFGMIVAIWALTVSIVAIRDRGMNRGTSRNMPFISLIIAIVALGISVVWLGAALF